MLDPVKILKSRARSLQTAIHDGNSDALAEIRKLREFRQADDAAIAADVRRRHCLGLMARRTGFDGWPHALQVLEGRRDDDFGRLLCPGRCMAHINIWSADYADARTIRLAHGGILLAYRRQYLIVESGYIRTLGLAPDDPDWDGIDRDWVRPADPAARRRLYGKLIQSTVGH